MSDDDPILLTSFYLFEYRYTVKAPFLDTKSLLVQHKLTVIATGDSILVKRREFVIDKHYSKHDTFPRASFY